MERNTISRKVNSSSPPSFSSSAAETVADIQDLLTEILLRVPARSVVRLKCISKHWYCLISKPEFRRRHILQNPNPKVSAFFSNTTQDFTFISLYKNPPRIFIHDLYPGNHRHSINPFKTLNIFNNFVQGNWNDFGLKILQSCNGLFLCVPFSTHRRTYQYYHTVQYYSIYVVNPTTNEFMAVSPPRVGKGTVFERYALAFDPFKSTHYKVICISTIHKHNWLHQVDVYSSETRSWRLLKTSFASRDIEMQFDGRSREGGVYCNGAVHWIRDEKELPISVGEDGNSLVRENADLVHYYDISEERLGLAIPSAPVVMGKDYSGWFVKYHVDLNPVVAAFRGYYDHFSRFYVLFLDGEGKEEQVQQQPKEVSSFLLFHIPGKVISYNLRSKTCKTYVDLSIKDYFLVGGHSYSYMETLASL
ncbi:hypothetical protein ACLB2K_035619 [Fragaria x ananassa]